MARKKKSWIKLVADGKLLHVFASSRLPKSVQKLLPLAGIELLPATKEERKPFIKK